MVSRRLFLVNFTPENSMKQADVAKNKVSNCGTKKNFFNRHISDVSTDSMLVILY